MEEINSKKTLIVFFPFEVEKTNRCYLTGDLERFDDVDIFFTTDLFDTVKPHCSKRLFSSTSRKREKRLKFSNNLIFTEFEHNLLSLKKLKIEGNVKDASKYHIIWINYNFKKFAQCEVLCSEDFSNFKSESYFELLKKKIVEKVQDEKVKKITTQSKMKNILLIILNVILLKLVYCSGKLLPVTKYFNIALHIDSYLQGLAWAVGSIKEKKKLEIKVINLLLSVFLDMLLGIIFLNWLNSQVSLDNFSKLFLVTAETIVNSIKDLIHWLRGDPAGLKLNWAFNKVLGMFFSFHIDIWWTFIAILNPVAKVLFQVFLKLGFLGITFQASILADLLALVSFHVYWIYAYAAKLYSIQISTLISLWRLFLGRKKNPLRGKVDSCRYSSEQLFVGTLGFTILLFLLPTTLLYYIVFTCIRLSTLTIGAVLMLVRYLNQTLPVYSTFLWLFRSSKVSVEVEIMVNKKLSTKNFIHLNVKPVTNSWWETAQHFTPDCVTKPSGFKLSDFLSSLISGKLVYPI